jgi:hypothetical protein
MFPDAQVTLDNLEWMLHSAVRDLNTLQITNKARIAQSV